MEEIMETPMAVVCCEFFETVFKANQRRCSKPQKWFLHGDFFSNPPISKSIFFIGDFNHQLLGGSSHDL